MLRSDIKKEDCPEFYWDYIEKIPEDSDLTTLLENQYQNFPQFLASIPGDKWEYRYAKDKWTLAQVLVHLLDTERVFQYRALCFGRKDETALPGFDQDEWAEHAPSDYYTPGGIVKAYSAVRTSTISLFETFSEEDLKWKGKASGKTMSLGAIGFIIAGHQRYHRDFLRSKYLDD